ncbi:amidase [Ancylobacter oerskovii]|uniref:Amidase n=1 Tax=Ancylobacter oerskovii TaxID=459519 RepID=A0ABW4YYQ1_9HYPH|nr:amidase [Ancylobacter oerskovii]MBS7541700.1 amidase [Ancylobacter oerskovii]
MTVMLSACALAAAVRSGDLTPAEVAARCAAAINAREKEIRAFTALNLEAMQAGAQRAGLAATPLAGLPVGVKDVYDTVDFPTTYGSRIYAHHRPAADAAVVRMIARAGGLVPGKTTTTEFAFTAPATTRNPHRTGHTPGGSSSGSAAAVAAGMLPLAIGSQTAGSVIRPASFCGVTGFKPSFKLIPMLGSRTFSWSLDTLGLFAAGVEDVAFGASAITGRPLTVDPTARLPRLAVIRTPRASSASPDADAALTTAARAAEKGRATVREITLPPEVESADDAHAIVQGYEAALALADEWDRHRGQLSPQLVAYLEQATTVTPEAYDAARRVTRLARNAFADLVEGFDAVLTYSAPGEAPEGLASTGSSIFNRLWTLLGAPCVNVAGLTGASGLPIGVQIVGRFGRDRAALTAAAFVEKAIRAA